MDDYGQPARNRYPEQGYGEIPTPGALPPRRRRMRRPLAREWVLILLLVALVVSWVVLRPTFAYVEDHNGSRWVFVLGDSGADPNPVVKGPRTGERRILIRGIYRGLPTSRAGTLGCAKAPCRGPEGFRLESHPGAALYASHFADYNGKLK